MSESESEYDKRYALRFIPDAVQDIEAAFHHQADTAGFDLAQEWRGRLAEEIASLATNPTRFPLAPEHRLFRREVRHLVWRRTVSSVAYRIIFWIEQNEDDAPAVVILQIRHGSAKPISRKEAKKIQGEE